MNHRKGAVDSMKFKKGRLLKIVGDITDETSSDFLKWIHKMETSEDPALIAVNSNGGDLESTMAIADMIRLSKVRIFTMAFGMAKSGAALIVASGNHRVSFPNTNFMIHQMHTRLKGAYDRIVEELNYDHMLHGQYVQMLSEFTRKKPDSIRKILQRDYYMNSEESKKFGLIDEILDHVPSLEKPK